MLKEIEHGRSEPAHALARFWIGGLWRFARVTGLFTSLRRLWHRTHQNTGCLWIGHHQFADVRFRIVETLLVGAVYRVNEDAGLCRHLLSLVPQCVCLHT